MSLDSNVKAAQQQFFNDLGHYPVPGALTGAVRAVSGGAVSVGSLGETVIAAAGGFVAPTKALREKSWSHVPTAYSRACKGFRQGLRGAVETVGLGGAFTPYDRKVEKYHHLKTSHRVLVEAKTALEEKLKHTTGEEVYNSLKSRYEELETAKGKVEKAYGDQSKVVEGQQKEIDRLTNELAQKTTQISSLTEELAQKTTQIGGFETRASDFDKQLSAERQARLDRQQVIEKLKVLAPKASVSKLSGESSTFAEILAGETKTSG